MSFPDNIYPGMTHAMYPPMPHPMYMAPPTATDSETLADDHYYGSAWDKAQEPEVLALPREWSPPAIVESSPPEASEYTPDYGPQHNSFTTSYAQWNTDDN